jgi:DNA repair protein SbcD/Mre11
MELFMEFYELQNNQSMSQVQEEFVRNIIQEVKE